MLRFDQARTLAVTVCAWLMLACSPAALAEVPKIAVLHWQGALLGTEKVQAKFKALQDEFSGEQAEFQAAAQEVEGLQQKLKKDGAVLSDAEKRKLAKKLEENLNDYKYLGGKLKKQVNERQQEILVSMKPDLERAVKEIIEAGGYQLVIDGTAVLYVDPVYDITAEVTRKLNENL